MAIHLGLRFPGGSSGVPGPSAGRVSGTCFALHRTGFGKPPCHHGAGGLLPHRFTLTDACAPAVSSLFHFPSAFAAWGFPSVLALWCPDFPRTAEAARGHPACRIDCTPSNAAQGFALPRNCTTGIRPVERSTHDPYAERR